MSGKNVIEKIKILQYLDFAPSEMDLLQFAKWLAIRSGGVFEIIDTSKKEKNLSVSDQLKRRG